MANNSKNNKIPVAEHGLHKHPVNTPRLFTHNFFEHIPVLVRDFKKDSKIDVKYNFFNRLFPLPVPALVTGMTKLYGYFVPYQSIFPAWYDYISKTKHTFSDGASAVIEQDRCVRMSALNAAFISNPNLVTQLTPQQVIDADILYISGNDSQPYKFTPFGTTLYKILCALGLPLSFDADDSLQVNVHKALAYIRVMYDNYFPLQYYGNSVSDRIRHFLEDDTLASLNVDPNELIDLIGHLVFGYFDNSWIESVWDNPVSPNTPMGNIVVSDPTNDSTNPQMVTTNPSAASSPSNASNKPSNGTPFIGGSSSGVPTATGVITQFVIDALESVNNFVKRRGLSGNRLIENYLTQRGVMLPSDVLKVSFKTDEYTVPFCVDDVENNSDTNLGELAGKGVSAGKDFRFRHTFTNDGIFIVMQVAVPDSEPLLAFDPYNLNVNPLDFQNGAFEKLGVDVVRSRILYQNTFGVDNRTINSVDFGYFKRYFYDNVDFGMVFGDFRVPSRGSAQLNRYHTFRDLAPYVRNNNQQLIHSYDFLRVGNDYNQFSRIFYTDKQDNMICLGRFYGDRYTPALPFGDSYDWNDDEMNKKVEVLASGNKDV